MLLNIHTQILTELEGRGFSKEEIIDVFKSYKSAINYKKEH